MDTQRREDECPQCLGTNGHHDMNCPTLTGRDAKVTQDALPEDDKSAAVEQPEGVESPETVADYEDGYSWSPSRGVYVRNDLPGDHHISEEVTYGTEREGEQKVPVGLGGERDSAEGSDEIPPPKTTVSEIEDALGRGEDVSLKTDGTVEFDEQKPPPTTDDFSSNDLLWLVAKTCHEVNRAYCASIGDRSHLPWEETRSELRASVYDGVVKHFENPDMTPEDSHGAWLRYKTAEGRRFGNMKDAEAKTHPCMVPYYQLHAQDRAKDELFAAICKSMFGGEA